MRLDSILSTPRRSPPAAIRPEASRDKAQVVTPASEDTKGSRPESSFEDMSTHCLANSLDFAKFFCSNEDSDDDDDDKSIAIQKQKRHIATGAGNCIPSLNTNLSELTAGTGLDTATRSWPTTSLLSAPRSTSTLPPPLSKANPIHSMESSLESVSIADGMVKGFINNAHLNISVTDSQKTPCISNSRPAFSHDSCDESSDDEQQRQSEARKKLFRLANHEMASQGFKNVQVPEVDGDLKTNELNTTPTRKISRSPYAGSKDVLSKNNECDETLETAVLDLSMSPMSEKNNKSTDNSVNNDKDDADNGIEKVSTIPSDIDLIEQEEQLEVVLLSQAGGKI